MALVHLPKSPDAVITTLSLVLQLLGLSLILLALSLLIPVVVNLPDSWLGAVLAAMLATAGVGLVRRGARLRKAQAQREEPAVRSRWTVAMAGAMNSLILVALAVGAAFAWSLVGASPH